MIVVDPRFTRTAATADLHLQIRAGADIAFLGGVIHYALENQRVAKEYLVNFTNAAFVVKEGFKLPEDGLYSGFDAATQTYDKSSWNYEGNDGRRRPQAAEPTGPSRCSAGERRLRYLARTSALRLPVAEETVLALHAGNGGAHHGHSQGSVPEGRRPVHVNPQRRRYEKVATVIYAVGWTQHTLRNADYPHRRDAAVDARVTSDARAAA